MLQTLHERCAPYTPAPHCTTGTEPAWVLRVARAGLGYLDIQRGGPGVSDLIVGYTNPITKGLSGYTPAGTPLAPTALDAFVLPITPFEEDAMLEAAAGTSSAPLPEFRIPRSVPYGQTISFRAWFDCDYVENVQFYWGSAPAIADFEFDPMAEGQPYGINCDSEGEFTPNPTVRTVNFPNHPTSPTHQRIRADFRKELHSADWRFDDSLPGNGDFIIDPTELALVNLGYYDGGSHEGYACHTSDGEDGYQPKPVSDAIYDCAHHDTDYNPQNWDISLSELLRLIQFYNFTSPPYSHTQSYHLCPGQATEDGFCPGTP
jgi:hypothetical protein